MFFIGIFGIETKEKNIRDVQNVVCKGCEQMSSYRLVKAYSFFHFFFIPLFKWGTKYYLISRCCESIFEISRELGQRLEEGEGIPLMDGDLIPVRVHETTREMVCPSCRRHVDSHYSFCPHCGNKLG